MTGEVLQLYNYMQEQKQGIIGTFTAEMASVRTVAMAAAVDADMNQKLNNADQGIVAVNQKLEKAVQSMETQMGTLMALMTTSGTKGHAKKVDITESKPINNLKEFGGGDREQFREWARKLMEVMQQL